MTYDHDEYELEIATLSFLHDELGWDTYDATHESFPDSQLGRNNASEVVLAPRLDEALGRLNPDLPGEALGEAAELLTRARPPGSPVRNNRDVWKLLRDGAKVEVVSAEGAKETVTVRYVDWDEPDNNDFLAVRQFTVVGDLYKTRTDILGFVNGIPLLFIELKAPQINVKHAFDDNLTHYTREIPNLFDYNGVSILSNGGDTRVGSFSAPWDHFAEWKKVSSEGEAPNTSIETALGGVCAKDRLLDLVENFTLFQETQGGLIKILAKNHQYLGVNNALDSLRQFKNNQGRLGVFWHTQGSGKSFSMIFFAQKALRKVYGGYSFVVVTDRADLDDQIYKNFVSTGAVTKDGAQAESGAHLKELLTADNRYVFTLIQKFRTETGETYPTLTERDDIIVIVDEAHRTQYDTLALNLRNALPNAAFLAFTGTPLIAGEERTREVFGDYVSVYNFRQSIEDRATVPLYYENRSPEVQLINEDFNRDMEAILEDAELDEDQERRLAREFSREYHLITDEDRLDTVAKDLVDHFINRGHKGKAMVVSIDKATAVKMHDKVQAEWSAAVDRVSARLAEVSSEQREALEEQLAFMIGTDMAVVVSASQNEIADMAKKGVDIEPHRRRMVEEDLDVRFKDGDDPLRIVFVCAMWLTGFDAPATSTLYLDKPMRNHTLMQTIARANRVQEGKKAGEIIDYIGVFRKLQEALAIYGAASGGGVAEGDMPVASKEEQADDLAEMLTEVTEYCTANGVDVDAGIGVGAFDWVAWLGSAAEALLVSDEVRRSFLARADAAAAQWRAVKPHPAATESQPLMSVIVRLAQKIRAEIGVADISHVMNAVDLLIEQSVDAKPFEIAADAIERVNLSEIDFDKLAEMFSKGKRNTAVTRLRASLEQRIERMARLNSSRLNYGEKPAELIDRYNKGVASIEQLFEELKQLAAEMDEEEQRHAREGLSEEELALFDLLTKPEPALTKKQEADVKKIVRELLEKLKHDLLVLDWKKRQATRASVEVCIKDELDELPAVYGRKLYAEKVSRVFEHVFENYQGAGVSVYEEAA